MAKFKIAQGNCLEVLKRVRNKSIDLILCDPPYGTTQNKWDSVIDLPLMWVELNRVIKDGGAVLLFSQNPFSSVLVCSNLKHYKYDWVWIKDAGTGHLNAKKYPMKDSELINVFCSGIHKYNPQYREGKPYTQKSGKPSSNYDEQTQAITVSDGKRYPLTTLYFKRDKDKVHPTQKPVELLEYLIKTYTDEGATVLDFTMGSGSTGVAALNTNRNFVGIELDANYFQIAKSRLEAVDNG